jgi:putative glycosyltransferase (TIGR04372 family)
VKLLIIYCFGIAIILILKILKYFVKIKFCRLYTERIGHLTINFDNAILSVTKNTYLLCFHSSKVANNFILNFFKKQKNIFFNSFFKYFYNAIFTVNSNSDLIISWKQFQPEFCFNLKLESKIIFPSYSDFELDKIFSKYNVKKDFVCLHARNNRYLEKHEIMDKNFHDYRNFNFDDFELVINFLKKKNNSIIKIGETFSDETFKFEKKDFFTSLDFQSNEEIDYLLNAYSRYNIIGNSGISGISSILRKKIIYINFIPFNLPNLSYCSPGSLILPKKIFDNKKNRFLTFKENVLINYSIHSEIDPYLKKHLTVINNSPQEILDVVIEMEQRLIGNNENNCEILNDQFWKSITINKNDEKINYLKNELKLSISNKFLKNNQNLL